MFGRAGKTPENMVLERFRPGVGEMVPHGNFRGPVSVTIGRDALGVMTPGVGDKVPYMKEIESLIELLKQYLKQRPGSKNAKVLKAELEVYLADRVKEQIL